MYSGDIRGKGRTDALAWYRRIGDKSMLKDIARCYYEGEIRPHDAEFALLLYASTDDMETLEWVGDRYMEGIEVPQDLDRALDAYYRSCEKGNSELCRKVAYHLFDEELFQQSERFFRILADQGDRESQYIMGVLNDGLGGHEDLEAAYRYYSLAAEQGISDAKVAARQIGKRLKREAGRLNRLGMASPDQPLIFKTLIFLER